MANLPTPKTMFLLFLSLGVIGAIMAATGLGISPSRPDLGLALVSLTGFAILGLLFAGMVWLSDTFWLWRRSLTRRSTVETTAAEALRKKYARGR